MTVLPVVTPVALDDVASRAPVPPSRAYGAAPESACSGVERFIDGINLLQHLPGVADAYRAVTGDRLCSGVRYFAAPLFDVFTGGPAAEEAPLPAREAAAAVGAVPPAPVGATASAPPTATESGATAPQDLLRYLKPEAPPVAELVAETPAPVKVAGAPIDLLRWLQPAVSDSGLEPRGALDDPYGPVDATAGREATLPTASDLGRPAVPPAGLAEVAAHPANHLPLAVLEVLQDRHRSLIAHERT